MRASAKRLLKTLLRPLDFSIPVEVDGQRWRMPVVRGQTGGYLHLPEPWMSDALRRLFSLRPDSAFMDVGVNMGQTLIKVKGIGRDIAYVGFEPNPYCVQYVRRFIEENHLTRCEIVPVGLGDVAGVVPFYAHTDDDPGATVVDDSRQARSSLQRQHVAVFPLDSLAEDLQPPDVRIVKIDIEGAELAALSGMRRLVEKHRPWIMCEVLHADSEASLAHVAQKNRALLHLLHEHDYAVHRLVKSSQGAGLRGLEPVDSFSEGVFRGDLSPQLCDYLFVPRQALAQTLEAFGSVTA